MHNRNTYLIGIFAVLSLFLSYNTLLSQTSFPSLYGSMPTPGDVPVQQHIRLNMNCNNKPNYIDFYISNGSFGFYSTAVGGIYTRLSHSYQEPFVTMKLKEGTNNEIILMSQDGTLYIYKELCDEPYESFYKIGKANILSGSIQWSEPQGDAVYVMGNRNLIVTRDSGATWQFDTTGIGQISDYTLDSEQNLYAIDNNHNGLYKQIGSVNTWSSITSFPTGQSPQNIFIDRKNRIFVASRGNGVLSSTDLGITWKQYKNINDYGTMCDDVFGNVYLLNSVKNKIYRTTDGGNSWEEAPGDIIITNLLAKVNNLNPAVINDIYGDTILTASTVFGIFESSDFGTTWSRKNIKMQERSVNSFFKHISGRLIETTNNGLFTLNSGDISWQRKLPSDGFGVAGKIQSDKAGNLYVNGFTAQSTSPIVKSTDSGSSWSADTAGIYYAGLNGYFVDELGNSHTASISGYTSPKVTFYFKSQTGSYLIDTAGIGIRNNSYDYLYSFGSDGTSFLYASGRFSNTASTWKRPLNGGTWTVDTTGTNNKSFSLFIHDNNSIVYASPLYNASGLFVKKGSGWSAVPYPSSIPSYSNVSAMTCDNKNNLIAAFSTYSYVNNSTVGLGVFSSSDYGLTWKYIGLDSVYVPSIVNFGADTSYAITQRNGIFPLTSNSIVLPVFVEESNTGETSEISFYPTPAKDYLIITYVPSEAGNNLVRIFDVSGEELNKSYKFYTLNERQIFLDIASLPTGIYFVHLGQKIVKFIKN